MDSLDFSLRAFVAPLVLHTLRNNATLTPNIWAAPGPMFRFARPQRVDRWGRVDREFSSHSALPENVLQNIQCINRSTVKYRGEH